MTDSWFRTFFDGAANDHWAAALPPEHTEAEAAFLVDQLALAPGDRVLDLPCGRGRLASRLQARGIVVVAADLSADGVRGAAAAGLSVVRADMRRVPLRGGFDGVACMGNSFGYFPVAGVEQWLAEVARLLRPGGRLVFESATAQESFRADFSPRTEHDFGGVHITASHEIVGDQVVSQLEVDDGTEVTERVVHQLVLPSSRIAALVEGAGLRVTALLGDLEAEPYSSRSRSLLVVAAR